MTYVKFAGTPVTKSFGTSGKPAPVGSDLASVQKLRVYPEAIQILMRPPLHNSQYVIYELSTRTPKRRVQHIAYREKLQYVAENAANGE
ncbi:MAG: hypothetical protein ACE5EM_01255 [Sphingomonadales bacterium]